MAGGAVHTGPGRPLHTKILIGLAIGAALGLLTNFTLGPEHALVVWVNKYFAGPIGQIFLRMLFMVVMPLVFASIALGVAGLGDLRKVGRVGGKAIGFFLGSTAVSATIGIILVLIVRPGLDLDAAVRTQLLESYATGAAERVEAAEQSTFGIQTLVNVVTRNPIKSMVDMDMLGVIFFGVMFGAALTLITATKAKPMIDWLDGLGEVMVKIVGIAMKLAPLGVAGLIFGMTSVFGFGLLMPLGRYVFVVLVGLALHVAITLTLIIRALGLKPSKFYSRIRPSIATAFSTSSSAATLPTNIAVAEQSLGIPPHIAGFVLPIGTTMCMNGTALYEGVTVIFLAQVFGVALQVPDMIVIMVMSVLTAIGAAGVPGGSLPLLVGILMMFGVPGEGIALILGIDRILDMSRTLVNNIGDLVATTFVARTEGVWNAGMVPAVPMGAAPMDESPGWPPTTT